MRARRQSRPMEDSSSSQLAGMGWGTKRWVGYLRVTHRGEGDGGGCERRDDGAFHVGDARVVGVGGGAHDATRSRGGSAALAPERLRGAREGEQVSGDDGGHLLAMCRARWGDFGSEESVGACAAHGRGDARGTVTRGARRDARCAAAANRLSARTTIRVAFGASRFGKIPSRAIGAVKWKSRWKSRRILIGWEEPLWHLANEFGIRGSGKDLGCPPASGHGNGKHRVRRTAHLVWMKDSAAGMKFRWHKPAQLAVVVPSSFRNVPAAPIASYSAHANLQGKWPSPCPTPSSAPASSPSPPSAPSRRARVSRSSPA